jgi:hypothetical protein
MKKNRIIYGCPATNIPTGGVKVIYRHAELLNQINGNTFIWHVDKPEFRCNWFENCTKNISTEQLSPETDLIVIPEIWASQQVEYFKKLGFKVCIFVQNAYMTHINLSPQIPEAIFKSYQDADLILSISKDSSEYIKEIFRIPETKIILQNCSIDIELFKPIKKNKIITYMQRKMGQHSARVISALQPLIQHDCVISAVDNLTEIQVARKLSESIIFLSFSEFEGLGLPPIEAALSGNFVVGYHGQGGKDFWYGPIF